MFKTPSRKGVILVSFMEIFMLETVSLKTLDFMYSLILGIYLEVDSHMAALLGIPLLDPFKCILWCNRSECSGRDFHFFSYLSDLCMFRWLNSPLENDSALSSV